MHTSFKRLHLFEFEDFSWYPDFIRKSQTDFLRFMMDTFDVFKAAMPIFADALRESGNPALVDLCSGGGGSMLKIRQHLKRAGIPFRATLTDLYPNTEAFAYLKRKTDGDIDFVATSVDARSVPPSLSGFRTVFNGFHHLRPEACTQLLRDSVEQRQPIGIFEPIDRSVWQLFVNTLPLLLIMILASPFLRPFRWERLAFTYLLPLIPLCTVWDGIASVLRLYTPTEMARLAQKADPEQAFTWQAGKVSHPFGKVLYLIGLPKSKV